MLNIHDIIRRVDQPAICSIDDIEDLRLMAAEFPYAQIFPILYLKALSNRRDIRFDGELVKYAYRVTDRATLYELVHEEIRNNEEKSITKSKTENPSQLSHVQHETTIDVKYNEEQTPDPESEDKCPIEENISVTKTQDDEFEETELIPLNIRGNEFSSENASDQEIESDFEKDMLAETISSAYELTLIKKESNTLTETKTQLADSDITSGDELNEEAKNDDVSGNRSFSSWLRSNNNAERTLFDEEKARIDAILEQFLEKEPRISRPKKSDTQEDRPKKEFFSAAKKAKESINSENMPVSETLARIFMLQGNYPKAIYAYEQLILTNPEKKTFFATQIEDLKKKLTS